MNFLIGPSEVARTGVILETEGGIRKIQKREFFN